MDVRRLARLSQVGTAVHTLMESSHLVSLCVETASSEHSTRNVMTVTKIQEMVVMPTVTRKLATRVPNLKVLSVCAHLSVVMGFGCQLMRIAMMEMQTTPMAVRTTALSIPCGTVPMWHLGLPRAPINVESMGGKLLSLSNATMAIQVLAMDAMAHVRLRQATSVFQPLEEQHKLALSTAEIIIGLFLVKHVMMETKMMAMVVHLLVLWRAAGLRLARLQPPI